MAGSCNGIVCVVNSWTRDFALWNPFTGTTLYSNDLASRPYACIYEHKQTALGFNHINDDYKVVRWHRDSNKTGYYKLSVYSLRQNSWTEIMAPAGEFELDACDGYRFGECGFAFANGAIHWAVETTGYDYETNFILAFDFVTYEFRKIPCAPLPEDPDSIRMSLSGLNGCLCFSYIPKGPRSMDIWVMKEYEIESSWAKIAGIDLPEHRDPSLWRFYVVAYSEETRKLTLQPRRGNLKMYDFDTKSLRDVAVDGEMRPCTSYVCVRSSISPSLLLAK